MGFNKIFLGEKALNYRYENGGGSSILEYLSKYDAYISTDELSRELIGHINLPKEEFLEKIDELFSTTNK
jgi:predicted Ser/Thr protein kinase